MLLVTADNLEGKEFHSQKTNGRGTATFPPDSHPTKTENTAMQVCNNSNPSLQTSWTLDAEDKLKETVSYKI